MSKIFTCVLLVLFSINLNADVVQGTFKINLGQQPTTINPISSTDAYASSVQAYIMEGLLTQNSDTYEWEPALAKSWKVSKDKMQFTFTLRDNAKWHDGKPVTVEDVVFSFNALTDKKNRWKTAHIRPYLEGIKKVKITGKNEVTFYAKNKYFNNFSVVAGGIVTIVPKHIYQDTSKKNIRKLNKIIIGSGPYKLKKIKRGKYLTLVANENWWGRKDPKYKSTHTFKKIMMRFIKDGTVAIQRMEKGDVDYMDFSAEEYVKKTKSKKWSTSLEKIKYKSLKPVNYSFIGWNFKKVLFQSKNVRKALYHLVNRELMIEKFLFGYSLPATGPWYRQSPYANKSVKAITYDPKKALSILKKEGWKDSDGDNILDKVINGVKTKFSFTIMEPNKQFIKYLTIFKEDAKKAGIDIKIKFVEWSTFIKLLDEKKFDACRLGWGAGSVNNDPKQIWHSDSAKLGGSNFISYKNSKVDHLIDKGRLIFDKKKRIKKWQEIYKLIAEDYPYVFFFNAKERFYGYKRKIKRPKDTFKYNIGTEFWSISK